MILGGGGGAHRGCCVYPVILGAQFGFVYPYLVPKYHFGPYLALLTYIYHYLPIFGCI